MVGRANGAHQTSRDGNDLELVAGELRHTLGQLVPDAGHEAQPPE
jgi:hypothetical protein